MNTTLANPLPDRELTGRAILTASPFPGLLTLQSATLRDLLPLLRYHYCPRRPATFCGIYTIHHIEDENQTRVVAVLSLSYPTLRSLPRERILGQQPPHWLNENLRNISRLIVHPRYRGIGLAGLLVNHAMQCNPVTWLECTSTLAAYLPLFLRRQFQPLLLPGCKPYFLKNTRAANLLIPPGADSS